MVGDVHKWYPPPFVYEVRDGTWRTSPLRSFHSLCTGDGVPRKSRTSPLFCTNQCTFLPSLPTLPYRVRSFRLCLPLYNPSDPCHDPEISFPPGGLNLYPTGFRIETTREPLPSGRWSSGTGTVRSRSGCHRPWFSDPLTRSRPRGSGECVGSSSLVPSSP